MNALDMPDESELATLQMRYCRQPESLEWKLLKAFLQLNQCWHCRAELVPEEHPRCHDCPEWDPHHPPSPGASQ